MTGIDFSDSGAWSPPLVQPLASSASRGTLSAAAADSNVIGMMTSTRIATSIVVAASVELPPTALRSRSNSGQVAIASTPAKTSAEMNGCSTMKMPTTTIAAPPKRSTLSKLAWMDGMVGAWADGAA